MLHLTVEDILAYNPNATREQAERLVRQLYESRGEAML